MYKRSILNTVSATLIPLLLMSLSAPYAAGMNAAMPQVPIFQKGMNYVTWSENGFASAASDESLRSMADAGVTCVSVVVTWYQEEHNSLDIEPTERTPSDKSVRHAIAKAHEYGMRVMLKPHIDLSKENGSTRSDIGFSTEDKWKKWFDNYKKFIMHYAEMAREESVELFCIGTELSFASQQTYYWSNLIIPGVREVFEGQIIYAANWDEYKEVKFWQDLDYIGIDAYFPLSDSKNPSLENLKEGWKKWLTEIEEVQRRSNKPVVFTEAGYCSSDSTACKPWEEFKTNSPNLQLQADCYKALFETFWSKPWFYGMYWWNWNTFPRSGGTASWHFTPQNKPALEYVKLWYAKPEGIRLAMNSTSVANAGTELAERLTLQEAKAGLLNSGANANATFTGSMARDNKYGPLNPPQKSE